MLSSEDSRRLAQLERQLLRDDPEFCARMSGADFGTRPHRRRSIPLLIAAILLWIGAVVLAILNLWIPAVIAAVVAGATAGVLGFRWARRRSRLD